jgi:membrane protease YdiL (CAAX protease family)
MIASKLTSTKEAINLKALIPFLLITFGIAWGVLALYIFLPEQMVSIFGEISGSHPLFYLAVYAPAIAAFIVITLKTGISGLVLFVKRFQLWRCSKKWYIFLLLVVPVIFYAGSAWKGNLFTDPFPFATFQALVAALIMSAIKGPVEEFGWRGFALPLLQKKLIPFWAALVLGIIWAFWHLPAFLLSGTQQSAWSFMPFFAGTVAISVVMTALFNDSKGSILLAAFLHFQFMNPIWPDAQPYDTYILAVIAVLIVWVKRNMFFSKEKSVTNVTAFE